MWLRFLFVSLVAGPLLAQPAPVQTLPDPAPAAASPALAPPTAPDDGGFQAWLAGYRAAALARGIDAATLDSVLGGLTPSARVVELDRSQPDDSRVTGRPALFADYFARRVDAGRIAAGRSNAERLSSPLAALQARTGVPASIILGIWGMESSFGRVQGEFDVPRSLATLAADGRRRALFTGELDAVLDIVGRGMATRDALKGSWAGAMGQPQFLPSSYRDYAVDGDGDGRADIWNSEADVTASIANFLQKHGWQPGLAWGQPVVLPPGFDRDRVRDLVRPATCPRVLEKHSRWITIGEWQALGLVSATPFPPADTLATLVEPDGPGNGAYLTTGNYRALLAYNCSNFYALSVALLGDAIVGR